ncbi:LysR substrate-binding domain-containing protein [Mesorhizobium sp. SP-1A]|uniref:LysR substrate-binding domain-containing protein n=1 Tax=Mesorhizobium sp. SP-1A TaxID=3077840 RepID=UPI0028F716A4|nr:LysR substrate-binding domain-containing protein [Mesorhizobium sp. SP-1A]
MQRIAVTNSIAFLKAMVQEGLGFSMLTLIDVRDEVKNGKLRFVPMAGARMSTPLSLSSRDVRALTEVGKAASELIANSLRKLEQQATIRYIVAGV